MSVRVAVLAIFVLSGAAGLVYEVVWARQLVLVFGNTTQAVSAILTGFFGGMAIGSAIGGRLADRVRSPLRLYATLELVLVVVVVLTPFSFRLIHEAYRGAYGALETAPQALALLRFALALLALGPATVLMGATLPTLTRHLARGGTPLAGAFGRLYAANTIGAVAGTALAGLVLIELLGLSGALLVGAGCSAVAGLVALALSRRADATIARGESGPADPPDGVPQPAPDAGRAFEPSAVRVEQRAAAPTLALLVAFVSGLTSLGYQVLWTRLLAAGTGNSTYVFTMILAVFLAGIAIGAVLFSLVRRWIRNPVALLAAAQVAVAGLAFWGLVAVVAHPPEIDPFHAIEVLGALWGSVLPVVLPTTIVMGLAFPAASALLADRDDRVATSTGALLASNTLGSIVGTFVIPFVVIPLVGSPSAVVGLALINVATALVLALAILRDRLVRPGVTVAAALMAVLLVGGLLRPGMVVDPTAARVAQAGGLVLASAEDEIAAVQAGRVGSTAQLWVTGTAMTLLTVDAKLMPVLPLIARPDSQTALTVAFGMGSSFRTALIAGLRVDAVELVPSVPQMFGYFYPDAGEVRANPAGDVIVADGRNHLELTNRTYDIIVTDPPPPIESSGASVISSLEYYRAGHARLNPGGIMMQWTPFGSDLDEFRAHVRTFQAVFPHVLIAFGPGGYGQFLLGSDEPIELGEDAIRTALARPGLLADLSSAYDSPATTVDGWVRAIRSAIWISDDAVARFAGDGPLVTDDRPLPEYFLLRRTFGSPQPRAVPSVLRSLAAGP